MKTKEQLIKVFEEVIEDIISREYEYKDNYIEFPETDRLCLLYTSPSPRDRG